MGLDNGIVALAGLPISVSGAVIGTGAPIRARGAGATQVVPRAVGAICLGLGVPLLCFATVAIVWSRWDRLDVFP